VATLGHHQEDSTHISDDVVTVGLTYALAESRPPDFTGASRTNSDGTSSRVQLIPGPRGSPSNLRRIGAGNTPTDAFIVPKRYIDRGSGPYDGIHHVQPSIQNGNWTNTIAWGRTRSIPGDSIFNSYLLESTLRFLHRNYVWTRIENVDRSNELILAENPLPPGFQEQPIGRVQAYTFGYDHDFYLIPHLASALGAQFITYGVADILQRSVALIRWVLFYLCDCVRFRARRDDRETLENDVALRRRVERALGKRLFRPTLSFDNEFKIFCIAAIVSAVENGRCNFILRES